MKSIENNNDLSLSEMFLLIWKNKVFIAIVVISSSVFGVFYSLSLENYFKSSALLQISSLNSEEMSGQSGIGGLASLAGINVPGGTGDTKTSFAIAKLNSKNFFRVILEKHNVLPDLMAAKSYDKSIQKVIYDKRIYDSESEKWVRKVQPPMLPEPSYLEAHEYFLEEIFDVSLDEESGFLIVSVEHLSPVFANDFLTIIIKELNDEARKLEMIEVNETLSFLNDELRKTTTAATRESISNLIETQLRSKMLAYSSEDFLLSYVDTPFIPERKSKPSRATICVAFFIMGLIASILIVLFKDSFRLYRQS